MASMRRDQVATAVVVLLNDTGKTRKDLAYAMGVTPPTLRDRLKGRQSFTMDDLAALSAFFDITTVDLLDRAGVTSRG